MELRYLPVERLGTGQELCVDTEEPKWQQKSGLGAQGSLFFTVPKVDNYCTKSVLSGAVRTLAAIWWNESLVFGSEER